MTKNFETSKGKFLAVEVPKGADAWINPYIKDFINIGHIHGDAYSQSLPKGDWKIIALSFEITDAQAMTIMGNEYGLSKKRIEVPIHYILKGKLREFNSLMVSIGCDKGNYLILKQKM